MYITSKKKNQWLGFRGGDDGAHCAFPDTVASSEGHAPIPIPICPPPLTQNPVSAPDLSAYDVQKAYLLCNFPTKVVWILE